MKSSLSIKILFLAVSVFLSLSAVSGFGYDAGEPLPNVTGMEIYNVTGLSTTEKRNSGELIYSGLNGTASINQTDPGNYRFSFEVTNQGASTWYLNSSDVMEHRNVNDAWPLEEVYYEISPDKYFGGGLSEGTVSWSTGDQTSLDVGESLYAEYIVNIPEETANYSQEFFVNDSTSRAGSRDSHKLEINHVGRLNVTMFEPPNNTVYQINKTFDVNATVECLEGLCGDVNSTPRYNTSSGMVPVPETISSPFYITRKVSSGCENLSAGEKCRLQWLINATGEEGENYLMDVNSSSATYDVLNFSDSNDSLIGLNSFIVMGLNWTKIEFGYIDPGQQDAVARCNDPLQNCSYNVVVENYSVGIDNLWIKGTDLVSENNSDYRIGVTNMSYSLENNISTEKTITSTYSKVASNLDPGTILSTFYWLDMPQGLIEDWYTGQITFKANNTG